MQENSRLNLTDLKNITEYLATHYSKFNAGGRLLFTGHSHQAWPDVAFEGYEESFSVSASLVDDKWSHVFGRVEQLRNYLRDFYNDPDGLYCYGPNVHQLLVSWLSALDLPRTRRIITTDGEFYSLERQFSRLEEEGIEIVRLPAEPNPDLPGQIEESLKKDPASAVILSRVFFESGLVLQSLEDIARVCNKYEVPLLLDDYHGTNVIPLNLNSKPLQHIYVLIGGYKYLQWGEANCFLRFPRECRLRPVITGWFAAFNTLEQQQEQNVVYTEPNQRFAGATFDGASCFRAAKVAEFFQQKQLTPETLRLLYLSQLHLLEEEFLKKHFDQTAIKLKHELPPERKGGFLALETPYAVRIKNALRQKQLYVDARGFTLRFGPAPYVTPGQIREAMELLDEVLTYHLT